MADINATVTPPLALTPDMLTDCSVPEIDTSVGEAAWNAAHAYAVGDLVARPLKRRAYRRRVAGTTSTAPEDDIVNWEDVGPTNRWRCLTPTQTSPTVTASPFVYEFTPGQRVTAVGLFGLEGDSLRIEVEIDGVGVYDKSFRIRYRQVRSMREYLATPFRYRRAFWRLDLPVHTRVVVRVTITRVEGLVSASNLILGRWEDLGEYRYDSETEDEDFSTVTRDDFGVVQDITRRRIVARVSFETIAPEVRGLRLRDLRRDLRATPAMWLPVADPEDPRAEALACYGRYTRWGQPYGESGQIYTPFEIEEF